MPMRLRSGNEMTIRTARSAATTPSAVQSGRYGRQPRHEERRQADVHGRVEHEREPVERDGAEREEREKAVRVGDRGGAQSRARTAAT